MIFKKATFEMIYISYYFFQCLLSRWTFCFNKILVLQYIFILRVSTHDKNPLA